MKRVDELTKAAENQEKELESDFKRLAEEKRLCELKLDQEMGKNTKLLQENTERELLLRAKREEVAQLKSEREKLVKMQEALKKKTETVEEQRRGREGLPGLRRGEAPRRVHRSERKFEDRVGIRLYQQ